MSRSVHNSNCFDNKQKALQAIMKRIAEMGAGREARMPEIQDIIQHVNNEIEGEIVLMPDNTHSLGHHKDQQKQCEEIIDRKMDGITFCEQIEQIHIELCSGNHNVEHPLYFLILFCYFPKGKPKDSKKNESHWVCLMCHLGRQHASWKLFDPNFSMYLCYIYIYIAI